MLARIASKFVMQDESDSAKASPLTVSSTEIAIKVPKDANKAVAFVFQARGADMRISEVTGMARYVTILNGNGDTLECADLDYIYVKRNATVDVTLHFYFRTI